MVAHDVEVGCWGGDGGATHWTYCLPDISCKFSKIRITSNADCITGIEFTYVTQDNKLHHSGTIGSGTISSVGGSDSKILDIPYGQNITNVSGTTDLHQGSTVITSLSFKVGNSWYGPYGPKRGTEFSLPLAKGRIRGFYGYHGKYVDCLGVVLSPID